MTVAVLDASALLALLLDEPGAEKVRAVMHDCAMTRINFGEVVAHFAHNGASAEDIHRVLDALPIEKVVLDDDMNFDVGLLITATRGLSFGDRACLALARRSGARAYTADRSWAAVAEAVGVEVVLVR